VKFSIANRWIFSQLPGPWTHSAIFDDLDVRASWALIELGHAFAGAIVGRPVELPDYRGLASLQAQHAGRSFVPCANRGWGWIDLHENSARNRSSRSTLTRTFAVTTCLGGGSARNCPNPKESAAP